MRVGEAEISPAPAPSVGPLIKSATATVVALIPALIRSQSSTSPRGTTTALARTNGSSRTTLPIHLAVSPKKAAAGFLAPARKVAGAAPGATRGPTRAPTAQSTPVTTPGPMGGAKVAGIGPEERPQVSAQAAFIAAMRSTPPAAAMRRGFAGQTGRVPILRAAHGPRMGLDGRPIRGSEEEGPDSSEAPRPMALALKRATDKNGRAITAPASPAALPTPGPSPSPPITAREGPVLAIQAFAALDAF